MENLRISLLNDDAPIQHMDLYEQILLALFDCCVAFPHEIKTVEILDKEDSSAELKVSKTTKGFECSKFVSVIVCFCYEQ